MTPESSLEKLVRLANVRGYTYTRDGTTVHVKPFSRRNRPGHHHTSGSGSGGGSGGSGGGGRASGKMPLENWGPKPLKGNPHYSFPSNAELQRQEEAYQKAKSGQGLKSGKQTPASSAGVEGGGKAAAATQAGITGSSLLSSEHDELIDQVSMKGAKAARRRDLLERASDAQLGQAAASATTPGGKAAVAAEFQRRGKPAPADLQAPTKQAGKQAPVKQPKPPYLPNPTAGPPQYSYGGMVGGKYVWKKKKS